MGTWTVGRCARVGVGSPVTPAEWLCLSWVTVQVVGVVGIVWAARMAWLGRGRS